MSNFTYDEEVETLLKKIEEDYQKAKEIRQKIRRLEGKPISIDLLTSQTEKMTRNISKSNKSEEFEEEASLYIEEYINLDENFEKNDLLEILPSKDHYRYNDIILRLQAESLKVINEIEEIIQNIENKEELIEYKRIIKIEKKKILILRECMKEKKQQKVNKKESNELILVPTNAGNIRLIDELEHIPRDFYPQFLELIESIIKGTFKGLKRFTNNNEIVGFCEVRGKRVRIVFTRIGKNKYALLSAFVKKCNNDKLYKETLISKISDYKKMEHKFLKKIDDEDFQRENKFNLEELYSLLGYSSVENYEKKMEIK